MPCVTLTVTAPPKAALSVQSITASPSSIHLGESTVLTIRVENRGDAAGEGTVGLLHKGSLIQGFKTGMIAAGETHDFHIERTPGETGTFEMCAEMI